jgi:nucleotide-binding universal stress UspA family protein
MSARHSIVCAIDFSDASAAALRYATALAQHFDAGLTLLTVDDPFLARAVAASIGRHALESQTRIALGELVHATFPNGLPSDVTLEYAVRVGEPAPEILRRAAAAKAGAIVMNTRGTGGVRKAVFGSTTERVLRQTAVPVFIAEVTDPGPADLDDLRRGLRTVGARRLSWRIP